MTRERAGGLIQHLLRHPVLKVVREDVKEMASQRTLGPPTEATVQFIAGGLFAVMMWWMGNRMRLSVDEL